MTQENLTEGELSVERVLRAIKAAADTIARQAADIAQLRDETERLQGVVASMVNAVDKVADSMEDGDWDAQAWANDVRLITLAAEADLPRDMTELRAENERLRTELARVDQQLTKRPSSRPPGDG